MEAVPPLITMPLLKVTDIMHPEDLSICIADAESARKFKQG